MSSTAEVLEAVRSADPLDPAEAAAWARSSAARDLLISVLDERPAAPARGRRRVGRVGRVAGTAVGVTVVLTGVAAASGLLGRPAPDRVKQHLASLDAGMPADLRYNPDVNGARSVAATASGVLYLATLADGGYCIEVVSDGDRPRGAACIPGADVAARPLEVNAPIPLTDNGPLFVGGRATSDRIDSVEVRYADGNVSTIAFGLDRAWLLEVPDRWRATALADGVRIIGLDATSRVVATVPVPPLRDDDPLGTAHDATQPIVVMTISDGSDFTRVLGVEGRINATGAQRLALRYPDGTTTPVDISGDGTYRVTFPADRRGAFATVAGSLIAYDAAGRVVATAPVASVAYWRARLH